MLPLDLPTFFVVAVKQAQESFSKYVLSNEHCLPETRNNAKNFKTYGHDHGTL